MDGTEGASTIRRGSEEGLDIPVAISDEKGRLWVREFSKGVIFKFGWIDHPDFAAITVSPESILQSGEIAAVELSRGFPVHFEILGMNSGIAPPTLAEVSVNLHHNEISDAASVLDIPFAISSRGFDIQLKAGQYNMLRLSSASHVLLPIVALDTSGRIQIAQGENDYWGFQALPKVLMRGRVVTADGKPVANAPLTGEVRNIMPDGSPAPAD